MEERRGAAYVTGADVKGVRVSDAETTETVRPQPVEEENAPEDSLEELSVDDLRRLASEADIEGRSSMSKAELVEALRAVD